MTVALESTFRRATVKSSHHKNNTPRPLCLVIPGDTAKAARACAAQIKAIKRAEDAGSYLFVGVGLHKPHDPALYAFVLSESRGVAQLWLRDKWTWLVGYYRPLEPKTAEDPPPPPCLDVSVEGLTDDLDDTILQMGIAK